jgi:hypothetical protein
MYDNLNKLVEFLSSIVELDLDHIDTKAIIIDQDIPSAKHLLQLILELILVLKNEQRNQEGEEVEMEEHEPHQGDNTEEPSQRSQFHSMDRAHKSNEQGEISEDYLKGHDSQEGVLSNSQVELPNNRLSSENKSERLNEESLKHSGLKQTDPNNYNNTSNNKSRRSVPGSSEESAQYVYNAQKSCPDLVFVDENNENSDTSLNKYNLKPYYFL